MIQGTMTPIELLVGGSAFGLVLSLWCIGLFVWVRRRASDSQRVENRLESQVRPEGHVEKERSLRLWHEGKETTVAVRGRVRNRSVRARLEQLRHDAGLDVPVSKLVLALIGGPMAALLVGYVMTDALLVGVAAAIATFMLIRAYLNRRVTTRLTLFENQLTDAMELAARSLRAGHPLFGAFRLISEEIPDPVGGVFAEIGQQQELGLSQEDAIGGAAAKSSSEDMKLFATSVIIQIRSGGNLADTLEGLAAVVRDRKRIRRRIRVLTAATQFSKKVLVAMPFIVFAVLNVVNPDYMSLLYDTTQGNAVLVASAGSLLLGIYTMNKMSNLSY